MVWFESKEKKDGWRTASLRYIGGRLSFPTYVLSPPLFEALAAMRRQLEDARRWVATIADLRMKKECESWCEYSEHCISACENELKSGAFRKSMDKINDEWERSNKMAADILLRFPSR